MSCPMTDHDALLRAICENPREDTPRLAFADWLEENGQPERAAFIRTDIAMSLRDEWDAERLLWEEELTLGSPRLFELLDEPWMKAVLTPLPIKWAWYGSPVTRRGFPWAAEVRDPRAAFNSDPDLLARATIEHLQFPWQPPDLRRLCGLAGCRGL